MPNNVSMLRTPARRTCACSLRLYNRHSWQSFVLQDLIDKYREMNPGYTVGGSNRARRSSSHPSKVAAAGAGVSGDRRQAVSNSSSGGSAVGNIPSPGSPHSSGKRLKRGRGSRDDRVSDRTRPACPLREAGGSLRPDAAHAEAGDGDGVPSEGSRRGGNSGQQAGKRKAGSGAKAADKGKVSSKAKEGRVRKQPADTRKRASGPSSPPPTSASTGDIVEGSALPATSTVGAVANMMPSELSKKLSAGKSAASATSGASDQMGGSGSMDATATSTSTAKKVTRGKDTAPTLTSVSSSPSALHIPPSQQVSQAIVSTRKLANKYRAAAEATVVNTTIGASLSAGDAAIAKTASVSSPPAAGSTAGVMGSGTPVGNTPAVAAVPAVGVESPPRGSTDPGGASTVSFCSLLHECQHWYKGLESASLCMTSRATGRLALPARSFILDLGNCLFHFPH